MDTTLLKILAIDDNPDNLTTLKAVLTDTFPRAKVLTALNGRAGLEVARAEDPDVILLDIVMPGMDGYAVCRELKSEERLQPIPVIFLTAQRTDRASRVRALEVGAEGFLPKPLEEEELIAQILAMTKIKTLNVGLRREKEDLAALVAVRTAELSARTRELEQELAAHQREHEKLLQSQTTTLATLEKLKAEIEARRQAEAARRASETKYREIFEHAGDAIFILDLSGRYLDVNQTACDRLGYSREELLQMSLWDFDAPEDAARAPERIQHLREASPQTFEVTHRRRDGQPLPTELRSRLIKYDGEPAILTIARDITERKQAEAARRESEARLNKAQRVANVGSWAWEIQANRLEWSDQMFAIFGIARENFSGDLVEVMTRAIHPADRPAVERANLSVLNGQPVPLEYRVVWPDGTVRVVWAEAGELVLDKAGHPLTLIGIVQDITERKQAEEKLRASETRFRSLVTQLGDGFELLDATGRYVDVNEATCRMLGYSRDEMLCLSIPDIDPLYDRAKFEGEFQALINQPPRTFETRHRRKDGAEFAAEVTASIINLQGEPFVLTTARDITGRKQAEEKLRRAEARRAETMDNLMEGCQIIGFDWRYLYLNEVAVAQSRLAREAFGGRTMPEVLPGVEATAMFAALKRCMEERTAQYLENEFTYFDGGRGWFELRIQPIEEGIFILSIDVTERKQTEAALRKTQAILQAAMDQSVAGIAIAEAPSGALQYVNDAGLLIRGENRRSMVDGVGLDQYVDSWQLMDFDGQPLDPDEVPLARAIKFGETGSREFIIRRAVGDERMVLANAAPIRDSQGAVVAGVVVFMDLTERKQAEQKLRESEERYRSLFNSMTEGFALHEIIVDADGQPSDYRFLDLNPAFEQLTGLKRENLIGQLQSHILPDEDSFWLEIYGQVALTGKPVHLEHYSPPLQRHYEVFAYRPAPYQFATLFMDITARKQMEEKLNQTLGRLELATRAAYLGVWDWDIQKNELIWDDQMYTLYGIKPADFSGAYEAWLGGVHPDDRAAMDEVSRRALRGERDYETEFRVVWPDGAVRVLKAYGRVARDAAGQPLRMTGVNYDITEIKRAEEDLRQLNTELEWRVEARTAELNAANQELLRAMRAKDEFLASMSHELRTPLTAVLGLSEALLLNTDGALAEKQAQYIQLIHQSGEHLLALINDVLDLAKVSAGRLEPQMGPVSVADICQVALHLVGPQAGKKQITVSLTSDPAVTIIQADARRLKQILVNLLGNAVKFTPAGGKIGLTVAGDERQRRVNFTVWDTGLGIAPEDLPRLFQDFVQLDARLARVYEGTGLGLAMVRRLVELHGGEVRAESDGLGRGSRFTVSLPWEAAAALETPVEQPPAAREAGAAASGEAPLILVVDDQPTLLLVVQGILKANAYQVETIQDSRSALAQARARRPALMLVDIQMPELDGLELIRQIRAEAELAALPIIALTALAMPSDREQCLRAGANDYLSKPIKVDELLRAISALLPRRL